MPNMEKRRSKKAFGLAISTSLLMLSGSVLFAGQGASINNLTNHSFINSILQKPIEFKNAILGFATETNTTKTNTTETNSSFTNHKNTNALEKTSGGSIDSDDDGDPDVTDCNDYDDTVYTGAVDLCDSLTNDCSDVANEAIGLDGWTNLKKITITNSESATVTNTAVEVNVAFDSPMKSNFDDVRFTLSDGTTLLNYALISKSDGVSATFW